MQRCECRIELTEQSQREAAYSKFINRAEYAPRPGVKVPYVDDDGNIVLQKGEMQIEVIRGAWFLSKWSGNATL